MTDPFVAVLDEYSAVRIALSATRSALVGTRPKSLAGIDRRQLNIALNRLEATYLVRIFAVYEAELETALGQQDLKLWRLVALGAEQQGVDESLLNAVEAHRRRRNDVTHNPSAADLPGVSLDQVVADLRKFVQKCRR